MTTCAIYSAGPFLEKTMAFDFPLSIAVNNAIRRVPADFQPDWYCAGDMEGYDPDFTKGRKPKLGWCAMDPVTIHRILTKWPEWGVLPHWHWGELPRFKNIVGMNYTISSAYLLAHMLGAKEIWTMGNDQIDDGEKVLAPNGRGHLIPRYPQSRAERERKERDMIVQRTQLKITDVKWPGGFA
jgi:hypothetical protein